MSGLISAAVLKVCRRYNDSFLLFPDVKIIQGGHSNKFLCRFLVIIMRISLPSLSFNLALFFSSFPELLFWGFEWSNWPKIRNLDFIFCGKFLNTSVCLIRGFNNRITTSCSHSLDVPVHFVEVLFGECLDVLGQTGGWDLKVYSVLSIQAL